jgi:OFA family oxalate/formate antiporter-like MFS transporter
MKNQINYKSYLTVISSFMIMLCLGGVYAWSILAAKLKEEYGFGTAEVQLIFGTLIAVFPATMILAGRLGNRIKPTTHAIIAAVFFTSGYLVSGFSNGNFWLLLIGTGVLTGIGTGFGYLTALTTPVKWFPEKKGLVTGIAAAGFGLASVLLSMLIEYMFLHQINIADIFITIGLIYGSLIVIFAVFLKNPDQKEQKTNITVSFFLKEKHFIKLLAGIFAGTFAGLLVIGNLSSIGAEFEIENHLLVVGVSVFAVANFAGRLSWGYLSDHFDARNCIIIALLFQGLAIFLTGYLPLTSGLYILLSGMIGFGFGANFVLFAKDTSRHFGNENLGVIYPYVFMGYALAGIVGPLTGGLLYDLTSSFHYANYIAAGMSTAGAIIFLISKK